MKIQLLLVTAILLVCVGTLRAQKKAVPENYLMESNEDYRKYASDVDKCVNWLEHNKINPDDDTYSKTVNFIGEWVSGSPFVNYSKNVRIDAAFNDCPMLRIYYMGGWVRNAIENGYKSSETENCLAGIRLALKAYNENKSLDRSKTLDELSRTDSHGHLKEWVQDRQ